MLNASHTSFPSTLLTTLSTKCYAPLVGEEPGCSVTREPTNISEKDHGIKILATETALSYFLFSKIPCYQLYWEINLEGITFYNKLINC